MKRVFLVTGASGFVGSALVNRLAELGAVTGLSRTPMTASNAAFISHDIAEDIPDHPTLSGATVVHCAAAIRSKDRQRFWASNVMGTRNVLAWCARHEVRHFILFSTGGVYGYVEGRRMKESDPVQPTGSYVETKYAAELEARRSAEQIGLQLTIFRLYFPFSRHSPSGIFRLIDDAIRCGSPLHINQAGGPRMTPIYIADVAEAVIRSANGRMPAGCYNLCGDEDVSFLDLVRKKERQLGAKAKLVPVDRLSGDMMGCNTALRRTGWQPTVRLDEVTSVTE